MVLPDRKEGRRFGIDNKDNPYLLQGSLILLSAYHFMSYVVRGLF